MEESNLSAHIVKGSYAPDPGKVKRLKGSVIVIKYGGNAMVEESARDNVLNQVVFLNELGLRPVVVHGGGPAIKRLLADVGMESRFVAGHRVTDESAIGYVEMALRGEVNGSIVRALNARKVRGVGLSGKDAGMVRVTKRRHRMASGVNEEDADLGFVGDVASVDTSLILTLLDNGYLPVLAPVATGDDGHDYNINADMFAGHIAGALQASALVAITDVDGLLEDPSRPETLFDKLMLKDVKAMMGSTIQGGMIPKIEACLIALELGVKNAHIINGMKPDTLITTLLTGRRCGTTIVSH